MGKMKRHMMKAFRGIVTLGMPALVVLAAAAGPLWAAGVEDDTRGTKPPVALGVQLGISDFTSDGYGSGFLYGLALNLPIDRKLSLTFSLGRTTVPVADGVLEFGKGHLEVTPLTFCFNYRWEGESRLVPYIYAGVGIYLYHFAPEATEPEQTADIAHRMAVHAGLGLDYLVSRDVGFGVDVRYAPVSTFVQPYAVVNPFPNDYPKIHLSTLTVCAVLKYFF